MDIWVNPVILATGRMFGMAIIQIAISVFIFMCYASYIKDYFWLYFSLLFPLSFGLLTNFLILMAIKINKILLHATSCILAKFIEYIAFLCCIAIFGR